MIYDLLIIGGGINGTGIAADAVGRGLSVALCEANDLASGTSSKSSKLIHGGLRYLEQFEFGMVRKALKEREILWRKAPHIIKPLRFVMPYDRHMRPAWMIRIGLFLYDHLGKRQLLPSSKQIKLDNNGPIKTEFKRGFIYSDCYVDDARLVVLNALQAKQLGARILTRTKVIATQADKNIWSITLQNTSTLKTETIAARAIVNATGPWVEQVLQDYLQINSANRMALVKGSHIVVPRLYPENHAYILQNSDKRVIFVIPFANDYSLIGTTDIPYSGDPNQATISNAEITYLCQSVANYFKKSISPSDIIWTYSGIRPLKYDKATRPSEITRDYSLELIQPQNKAPLLCIFGGKITSYRVLAEQALKLLQPFFPQAGPRWTHAAALPGGDIPIADWQNFYHSLQQQYHGLPKDLIHRYAHSYGTLTTILLNGCNTLASLGKDFGSGLFQREVEYLIQHEWAQTAEDILWRRTKLGLNFPADALPELEKFITAQLQQKIK